MSSAAKRKGTQGGEIPAVNWLKENGFPYAERRLAGSHLDRGDIAGVNGVTIEVKNHIKLDLSAWLKELEVEMKNDGGWTGVVLHKKKGTKNVDEWYCTMPAKVWLDLIKDAMRGRQA